MAIRENKIIRKGTILVERHSKSEIPEYHIWSSMKKRCDDNIVHNYHNYGGKGIGYDERWVYFSNFYEDMGNRPSKKHQLDRIDPDGHYTKENCRWTTPHINAANRKRYSKCIGAYKRGNRFMCKIGVDNHVYHIGTFDTKEQAQYEYIKVFKEWYGFSPLEYRGY